MANKPVNQLLSALKNTSFAKFFPAEQIEELHNLFANADQKVIDEMVAKVDDAEKDYQKKIEEIKNKEAEKFAKEFSKKVRQFKKGRLEKLEETEKKEEAKSDKLLEEMTKQLNNL